MVRLVWPNYYNSSDHADEVAYLKQWLRDRIAWMDTQLRFDPNAFVRGDVNGNGEVNISDLSALIDYLLTGEIDSIDPNAADCDKNGTISIDDLTTLIDYLLTGMWPL